MLNVSKTITRPRVAFDPAGYKQAKRAFEQGQPKKLIQMMKEAAIDSHVAGCLMGRRSGFKKSYALTPYDDSDLSQERLDFFRGVFQRIRLRELLEAIHDARLFLYHVIDFEWAVEDGRQVPTAFRAFDQRHFRRADAGDPESELVVDFGRSTRPIPETALVVETRKTPVMMPVLRDYILKEFGLESWASFLETFGEDFIFGKYPPGSDEDFKNEVEQGVNELASSSRGTAPQGTEIEVIGSDRNTGDHKDFTERSDTGIAITLLGHANAVEQSRGMQVGENLTSYQVRFEVAVDDMHFIEPHVNRFLQILGDRNFGDGRYPRFELNKAKPVDAKQHAEILDIAYRHGLIIDPAEYEKLGLKVSPDQEPIQKQPSSIDRLID